MKFLIINKKFQIDNKGFTLIEMAVVLIIIGLIIGAVVKGKDIVTSAKQKKLYAKFIQSWQISYNTYYDRTGWILGDDASDTNTGTRDGHCSVSSCSNITAQLQAVGLEVPSVGESNSACIRNYRDSQDRDYTLTLNFRYNSAVGNYIEISGGANGFPSELGITWDNIIDGQRGGDSGDFRYAPDSSNAGTFAAWPAVTAGPVVTSVAVLKLQF